MKRRPALVMLAMACGALLSAAAIAQETITENSSLAAKRRFVRGQMIREFADNLDSTLLAQIEGKVAQMPEERINQLIKNYLKRQQPAAEPGLSPQLVDDQQQAATSDARLRELDDPVRRALLIEQYKARLAAARSGAPGFAPVVTTLPSGTQLGASAVVSPDRRYVRMNLTPFFSSVGPVQNYTFVNPNPYYGGGYGNPQQRPAVVPWRP